MKTTSSFGIRLLVKPLFFGLGMMLLGLLAQTAGAATGNDTWLGNSDVNWATGGNWSPAVNAPPIGGDSLIFGSAGSAGGLLNNNIAANTAFNALTFSSGAGAFTFSGNAINLAGNVTDNASNTETINFPMAMTATRTYIVTNGGNLVLGGVISGAGFGITLNKTTAVGNVATPFNTGTLTLNGSAVSTYTGPTLVNGGTLLLDFANLATPTDLINNASALTLGGLGGGTLSVKGKSSGSTAQTLGNLTIGKSSGAAIILNPNGGTGTTLTLGNTWSRSGGACSLNIDLSAGGTLVSAPSSVAANNVLGFATVKDALGIGFASLSGGTIVRLTGQTTLPASGTSGTTDYITSGNVTMGGGGFGVNSLTLDASSGPGVLDLGGASDVMLISSIGLLMYGANDYTITNGQVGAANVEAIIHQMGTGTLTINGTLSSGSSGGITKNGPGTLVLGSTNSGAYISINQGTVRQGVANAIGATNASFTVNYGGIMDLNGYDLGVGLVATSGTGQGIVTNSGALANFTVGNGNNNSSLANALVTGPINLIITGGGTAGLSPANTHTGGTTLQNDTGPVANYRFNVASEFGTGPLTFNGGGIVQHTASLTVPNAVVVNGAGNGWWLDSGTYGSTGSWTGTGTINILQDVGKSPTFTFGGDMSGFHGTVQLSGNTNTAATVFTYSLGGASTFDGSHATWDLYSTLGTFSSKPVLQWAGTGSQTIKLGDLNSVGTTGNGVMVVSNSVTGTTATFQVGNLNNNSSFAGAFVSGAGAIALTKVGTGVWTLSGTNTYTGNTTIAGGTLALRAPAGATSTISNSPVISVAGGTIFDVSGMGSTFTLGSGQTLSNNASATGILNGSLNTGSGIISVSYAPGMPVFTVTNGTLTLSASTVVNINNTGSALAAGSYEIISTNSEIAGPAAAVTGTLPAVTVGGGGLASGATASLQVNGGELYLVVSGGSSSPSANAYLATLVLTPAGTLTPAFATNVFNYTATEAYGSLLTVTVTDADLTATNHLTINNTALGLLASGVASTPAQTLNSNPAVTNVVSVQVTAQDGVTVNHYTVNVVQLPSQTPPHLTNIVSGTTMTLNWPLDHLGYRLLMQTNNLDSGVSGNTNDWMTVAGSSATNTATITIIETNLNEYYRLVYP
ncbi:MAG TPA: cadherin-like beta sandwich domain-containing protein [Verrucomicrobiae bacterium]|nr:cadherin-like beta sandwich domain-containing protein [Verrucomicrobiae bacterium]